MQNTQTCPTSSSATLTEQLFIECWAEEQSRSGPPPNDEVKDADESVAPSLVADETRDEGVKTSEMAAAAAAGGELVNEFGGGGRTHTPPTTGLLVEWYGPISLVFGFDAFRKTGEATGATVLAGTLEVEGLVVGELVEDWDPATDIGDEETLLDTEDTFLETPYTTGDWDKVTGVEVTAGGDCVGVGVVCDGDVVVEEAEVLFSKSTAKVLNADAGVV